MQIRTKERVQNRTVKQIVEVVHIIPLERIIERVVEKIVDMQGPQVMETAEFRKSRKQVEYTQYQLKLVSGQNPAANRSTSGRHTCPANSGPSGSEAAQNLQDDDAEKTSECPDEWRQMIEQIEDTAKVKINKEKSQPRDQANRNSPDSRCLRNSSWAYQSPVVGQRQVPS